MPLMTEIASIVQALSILFACWAVIAGIDAWKREFIGKRRIEIAEQILAKFYEVKDAIAFIRSPWSGSEEGKSRKRGPAEGEAESKLLDRGYIVFERYEKRMNTFVELNTLKYRFMAAFGAESESVFVRINQVLNSIFISAQMLATHYWQRQGRVPMEPDEFQRHLDEMHKHEGVFWDRYNENDEVRKELSAIQSELEKITAPCFEEKMRTYTLFTKPLFSRAKKSKDTPLKK